MSDLLEIVLKAHGGTQKYNEFTTVTSHLTVGGALWALKEADGVLEDSTVTVRLHEEWASHTPFTAADRRSIFTPNRVAIETSSGEVIDELDDPRSSFAGHDLMTPWSRLQLAYFAGYAMWTYLTEPFSFVLPGVTTREVEPWVENGETWRRLEVTYPGSIATHSAVQTVYVDAKGLLRRRDYEADVIGGAPSAHYMNGHREVAGLVFPTSRRVFSRDADNNKVGDPLIVAIDLDDIRLS